MSITIDLLNAAEKRMRRGGYNAVSFRDLAQDTGIKSSSVHYHFPKKEDLANALIQRYAERFFDALTQVSAKSKTPQGKLNAFTKVYRSALVEDDALCLCGLLGAEIAGLPEPVANGVQAFFQANIKWVSDALPENMSASTRHKAASTVVAAHQGGMMLATSLDDVKLFDAIASTAVKNALS